MSTEPLQPLKCRSCGARIVFLVTSTGKAMPVDADTVQPTDLAFDHQRHRSHYATCPNANDWRKSRRKGNQ